MEKKDNSERLSEISASDAFDYLMISEITEDLEALEKARAYNEKHGNKTYSMEEILKEFGNLGD